jgi:hypothetical protein
VATSPISRLWVCRETWSSHRGVGSATSITTSATTESGPDHPTSASWYAEEGVRLGDELKQALPDVEVILDLWPVTNQPHSQ